MRMKAKARVSGVPKRGAVASGGPKPGDLPAGNGAVRPMPPRAPLRPKLKAKANKAGAFGGHPAPPFGKAAKAAKGKRPAGKIKHAAPVGYA